MTAAVQAPGRIQRGDPLLRDINGRTVDYIRVSLTDRCNLRCEYCVPAEDVEPPSCGEPLSAEEVSEILAVARSLGAEHVRFTGGEPLVRSDLTDIVRLAREVGFPDIALTTNGVLLAPMAPALREAGLMRVNVSLDSLRPAVFRSITGVGDVGQVLQGIRAAIDAGLDPVKINTVVMAGVNDGEIADIARVSIDMPVHVRFIEVMPIGPNPEANAERMVPIDKVKKEAAKVGTLEPAAPPSGSGPAVCFRFRGAKGTVGFIAPLSYPFCHLCNRMRVTADGRLRPCLSSDLEVDLRRCFKQVGGGHVRKCLESAFLEALRVKPKSHDLWKHRAHMRRMCQIGG